ncbi:Bug family tripartite tricarboxylate transporter substrate binding protein [Acidovorax sp. SDU_ACID1]|jgi:tripartite-type tricarboxylate transporter receptor subunit TctC|uniref:Bug family tripartite tricarboxylate transporter substrate binding protein n=1 Tax=Acidovorax sp. SDU_ACID1 TaxID=3136632 RepID=UPI003873021F
MLKKIWRAAAIAASLALAAAAPVHAQAAWPGKPIKFIVPTPPGGSPDIISRLLADELQKQLGQAVVVENRPGGGGGIGMTAIARSAPDGYTIGYGNVNTLAINRTLFKKLAYDVDRDIAPIAQFSSTSNLLVVRPSLEAKNVQELLDWIRKQPPGTVTGASPGVGTTGHMSLALFEQLAGVKLNHIPYQGSSAAYQDLIGNRVDIMFDNIGPLSTYVKAGTLRALGYTAEKRSFLFPEIPTMQEAGVKDFLMSAWGGIVAPAGTPREVVQRLNKEINTAMKGKTMTEAFAKIGNTTVEGSVEDFTRFIRAETDKWAVVVKHTGASLD